MSSPGVATLLQLALLATSLLASCRIDRSPTSSGSQSRAGSIRLRDGSIDSDAFGPQSNTDDARAEPEPGATCGDGRLGPGEVCDEAERNGSPGHCASDCTRLVEQLLIREPEPQVRISTPAFFDWEIDAANPDTTYCNLLMTDRSRTPEDRVGEQAFYTGTQTELIATLNARRYPGGSFSFAVIAVACDDRAAECQRFDCYSGSVCALPCAGRAIVSETRDLRGIEP